MYSYVSDGYEITSSKICVVGMIEGPDGKNGGGRGGESVPMTEVLSEFSYLPHDESGRKDALSTVYRS